MVWFSCVSIKHWFRFWKKWLGFIPEQEGVVFFWISLGSFWIYWLIVFLISVRKG